MKLIRKFGIQAGFQLANDILKGDIAEENAVAKYKEMYMSLFEDISKAVDGLKKARQRAEEVYISL